MTLTLYSALTLIMSLNGQRGIYPQQYQYVVYVYLARRRAIIAFRRLVHFVVTTDENQSVALRCVS